MKFTTLTHPTLLVAALAIFHPLRALVPLIAMAVVFLGAHPPSNGDISTSGEHPFLLFDADAIPEFRARATEDPWADIATAAIDRAHNLSYSTSGEYHHRVLRLKKVLSALSLAVLIDEATDPAVHTDRFYDQLTTGLAHLEINRPGAWIGNTPVGSMLFDAILALDVFHNHLDETRREELQALLDPWVSSISGWNPSGQSVRALWALYLNDIETYNSNRTAFLNQLFSFFTDDGVFFGGTNYALARLNFYDREQKHLLLDVIRRHEPDALSEARATTLRKAYEWTYGYAVAPHGWNHIFGDTSPNRRLNGAAEYPDNSPTAAFRVGRFSTDARAYANRYLRDAPAGGLLYFLLVDPDLNDVAPRLAPSRVFPDGGAWFQTETEPFGGISGALWNSTRAEGHTHKETNALSLVAYGNHLLANSGYAGWSSGAHGFSWAYINNRAVSGNTVLIDYPLDDARTAPDTNDHARKTGNGISSHLVSGEIDYAKGHSGGALPNGNHQRHFAFVHPLDGLPGYWVVLDEVQGNSGASQTHAAWHPYGETLEPLAANTHYRAQTKHIADVDGPHTDEGPRLHIHLTTAPAAVQTLEGVIAHFNNLSFVGEFLYNTYALNDARYRRFGTVFFPEPPTEPHPEFSRQSGIGWEATRLQWPDGTMDFWVVTQTEADITVGAVTLRGKAAWFRRSANGEIHRILLVEGTRFALDSGDGPVDQITGDVPGTLQVGPDQITPASANATNWSLNRPN